ncbi:alpha/beta hydrolase-fold protein [Kitasatospora sp. MAP5-34]|uniref:alpha/beta hydrolase n=1 Tax=Kitasatospora sp. MAP5-34 TaxID=3035102 RepID=UPI00247503AE|nr:alpha/beta hydrolase-fold protein [Kitasatospora sp. MAP5-34]MDH6577162.1 S-formylglutathione hydrolase FrmB [Kitasatospora sp. MAP5-34]
MSRPIAAWNPLDWSLTHGVIPYAVLAIGAAALMAVAVSRTPRWWTRRLPAVLLLAAGLTVLLQVAVDDWWQPFPDSLPRQVTGWIGVGILGLGLAAVRLPGLRWRGRAVAASAAVLVLLMSSSQVNRYFDQYPTFRVLLAPWIGRTDALTTGQAPSTVTPLPGQVLAEVWRRPAGLPANGTVSTAPIPGAKSGFKARDAYVYLPPAYQASPRPLLPVLVLLAGQPGTPADWVNSGGLQRLLDGFAAAHDGLAPVVVVADPIGSPWNNTLCLDSRIAKAQTYLAQDVPDWVHAHLQTATGRTAWSIGGLSLGGTCSLQLAVDAPQVYGSFLDISGQDAPTLGSHSRTVKAAFGGDETAFDAVDPLHVMARRRFPDTAAVFVVGAGDGEYGPQQRKAYAAAVKAGMTAKFQTVPGGHDWNTFRAGLGGNLPWLAQQAGLIR